VITESAIPTEARLFLVPKAEREAYRAMNVARRAYEAFQQDMARTIQNLQEQADKLGEVYMQAQDEWNYQSRMASEYPGEDL
jgi:hypothetical protein